MSDLEQVLSDIEVCQQDIIASKNKEIKNLENHYVFKWVDEQKTVSCKWMLH